MKKTQRILVEKNFLAPEEDDIGTPARHSLQRFIYKRR